MKTNRFSQLGYGFFGLVLLGMLLVTAKTVHTTATSTQDETQRIETNLIFRGYGPQ